jgi:hypothetical protein
VEFVGNIDRDGKQWGTVHGRSTGICNDHGYFGNDYGFCHADGDSAGVDVDSGLTCVGVSSSRQQAAVYGDGDLQQRDAADSDDSELEFVGGIDLDSKQWGRGYGRSSGISDDHGHIGND